MTTDIRAALGLLVEAVVSGTIPDIRDAINTARAALAAEPEPPVDGEVAELVAWLRSLEDASVWFEEGTTEAMKLSRAADLLSRLAPQPVQERPTDEELTLTYAYAVAAALGNKRGPFKKEDAEAAQLAGLRAALARWGQP